MKMEFRKFPESARREPPHPRRCSDGSLLSEEEEERNSNTSMVGDDKGLYSKTRSRPYYFRRCKRVRPTNIESLPNELLSNILVRLPADHLYDRARLVCRRWYHIIHSYDFVDTQTQHSTYGLLLSSHPCLLSDINHPIFITATQGRIETSVFSYVLRSNISSSCNGLGIEYYRYYDIPYIINPATKQPFITPPKPGTACYRPNCCLAFAPRSMRYKLTMPYWKLRQLFIGILTFGVDNSWRNVDKVNVCRGHDLAIITPLVTEGFVHWTNGYWGRVYTLDVETEILAAYKLPFYTDYSWKKAPHYLLSTGRFLSLFVRDGDFSWDVWEMRPDTGEWRRGLPDVKLGAQKCRLQQLASAEKDQVLKPVGWVKYPEVLVLYFSSKSRTCIFYNLNTHEINWIELPYCCEWYTWVVHKNTLTWLT